MAGALLSTAGKAILAKLGGKAVKAVQKVISKPAVRTVAKVGAEVATTVAVVKATGGGSAPNGAPPLPPGYSGPQPPPPGGFTLGNGAAGHYVPGSPVAITTPVEYIARAKAPRGYVVVDTDKGPIAMLAKVAYAMGLKKRPRKTTRISSRDIEGAQKVNRFITRFSVNRTPKTKLKRGKR